MPIADYLCRECGFVLEADTHHGEVIDAEHFNEEEFNSLGEMTMCRGRLQRIYSNIHTGSGSNGEPAR